MPPRVLVYGYGNPGRQDDAAGVTLVEELAARADAPPWLTFDTNYQLNAEDALAASRHEVVIFADASLDQRQGFCFRRIHPSAAVSFSTHAMTPESVIALAEELYGACPKTYLLTLRGFAWELGAGLTPEARANIDAAKAFLAPYLERPEELLRGEIGSTPAIEGG